ncbi:MAG: hemolysin family protein [Robiginitomaculum sp.]
MNTSGTIPEQKKTFFAHIFGKRDKPAEASAEALMSAAKNFHTVRVEDVMVPRAEIISISDDTSLKDITTAFKEAGHSRLPVYKGTLDEPTGMVHVKDLLPYLALDARGRTAKIYPDKKIINRIKRPVLFVPPSMSAQDLLRKMQAVRIQMAIVVDEYGGTDGLVTMEDLIEIIVGDIEDEHDSGEPEIIAKKTAKSGTYWEIDGNASIDDFAAVFGSDIATPEQDEEVDTMGGLVFSLVGRVPTQREIIRHPLGLEFEIMNADARRINKIRVRRLHDSVQKKESCK